MRGTQPAGEKIRALRAPAQRNNNKIQAKKGEGLKERGAQRGRGVSELEMMYPFSVFLLSNERR